MYNLWGCKCYVCTHVVYAPNTSVYRRVNVCMSAHTTGYVRICVSIYIYIYIYIYKLSACIN
jgi:hypothetical protein